MYGKPAMTYFKFQVYMYGSEAITYIFEWYTLSGYTVNTLPPPPPPYRQPSPSSRMVEEVSHIKQLFLNHVCKIGLKVATVHVEMANFDNDEDCANYDKNYKVTTSIVIRVSMVKWKDVTG